MLAIVKEIGTEQRYIWQWIPLLVVLLAIQWNTLKQFCYQELSQYTSIVHLYTSCFYFLSHYFRLRRHSLQVLMHRIRSVSVPKPRYFGWIQRFSKPSWLQPRKSAESMLTCMNFTGSLSNYIRMNAQKLIFFKNVLSLPDVESLTRNKIIQMKDVSYFCHCC